MMTKPSLYELIACILALISMVCCVYVISVMQWRSEWNREWEDMGKRMMVLEEVLNKAPVLERTPSGYAKFIEEE